MKRSMKNAWKIMVIAISSWLGVGAGWAGAEVGYHFTARRTNPDLAGGAKMECWVQGDKFRMESAVSLQGERPVKVVFLFDGRDYFQFPEGATTAQAGPVNASLEFWKSMHRPEALPRFSYSVGTTPVPVKWGDLTKKDPEQVGDVKCEVITFTMPGSDGTVAGHITEWKDPVTGLVIKRVLDQGKYKSLMTIQDVRKLEAIDAGKFLLPKETKKMDRPKSANGGTLK